MPLLTTLQSAVILLALAGLLACGSGETGPTPVADQLTQAQAASGGYIVWKEHLIDDEELAGGVKIRGGDGLKMADLDKDGIPDIVSVHEDSDRIRLAFGSDDPDTWFRLSLAEGAEAGAAEDVAIGDLNGDDYPDVIAACEKGHLIYFQNPGGHTPGGTVRGWRWDRVIPDVTRNRGSFIRVFLADVDSDGRLEIVAANKGTGRSDEQKAAKPETEISWFEAPENTLDPTGWTEHVITWVRVPINAPPIDLDGDGDIDVLAGSRGEKRILWFENQGGAEPSFEEHAIEAEELPAGGEELNMTGFNVEFHDLSGDGRLDIVLARTRTTLVWLEQPTEASGVWKVHPIGTLAPDHVTGIAMADINGDGRPDVMTGGYSRGPRDEDGDEVSLADPVGRLAWFENPADPAGAWTRHDISRRKRGMFDAFVPRDLDNDGDLDFVGTRGNSGEFDGVFWLEQQRATQPVEVFEPARESESRQLPLPVE